MTGSDHERSTRLAYDAAAEEYTRWAGAEIGPATEAAIDRALLAAFAEEVACHPAALVADLGCGPGRVAALLARSQLDVVGIDLSSAMVEAARRAHPGVRLGQGSLTELPLGEASLAGAACWYSIIHTPPQELRVVVDELARVLAPGGHLLLAFQAGEGEAVHRDRLGEARVSLTNYRHAPDAVDGTLSAAGFEVRSATVRQPEFSHESTPQAFITARRSG